MVQSRLVSSLLTPALQLWLRSQVESVEALTINIEGSDRQILGGHIPGVSLQAQTVIYQGLHLSSLDMTAATIRINIGQVVRGKPLKLLAPIPVETALFLNADELNRSTTAPLLKEALVELWQTLCTVAPTLGEQVGPEVSPTLRCGDGYLEIHVSHDAPAPPSSTSIHTSSSLVLRTVLCLKDGHYLEFSQTSLYSPCTEERTPMPALNGFHIDLGSDVSIQSLEIDANGIDCRGCIRVMP